MKSEWKSGDSIVENLVKSFCCEGKHRNRNVPFGRIWAQERALENECW